MLALPCGSASTIKTFFFTAAAVKKNVLIVDADPQGNASTGLGLSYDERKPSIYEMIHEKKLLREGIKDTLIPGLKIIGANTDLAKSVLAPIILRPGINVSFMPSLKSFFS